MRILLIRHGEPDYSGDCLTPKGQIEAELLALRLSGYQFLDLYTSPLGRAVKTAEPTLRRLGRKAETLPWLQEFRARYIDPETGRSMVVWDRKPRFWCQWPESLDPEKWADIPPYQGTDVRTVWEETKAGVDALMARYGFRKDGRVWLADNNTADTIGLFCHFGISMAILGYLTEMSPLYLWHHMICLPSGVTEVVTEERIPGEVSFRVTKMGDLTHLEMNGEPASTHGLYPECYTGVDLTDPQVNGMPLRKGR